jgi:hypothetical protein
LVKRWLDDEPELVSAVVSEDDWSVSVVTTDEALRPDIVAVVSPRISLPISLVVFVWFEKSTALSVIVTDSALVVVVDRDIVEFALTSLNE